jgi:hypothetical protein
MEPVSFTIGVVGLVGTFTACVDCFEYFRVGRHLGEDYETCVVKLDLVRLRLTRWGSSVGISGVDDDVAVAQLRSKLAVPEKDFDTVMGALIQILKQFERAADISNRSRAKSRKYQDLDNEQFGLNDDDLKSLHEKMKQLAIRRQKAFTLMQKTKWALYRKRDFTNLIADLTEFVTALVDLVPAAVQTQVQMCDAELSDMGNDQSLVLLDQILAEPVVDNDKGAGGGSDDEERYEVLIDEIFRKKVMGMIDERKGTTPKTEWVRTIVGDNSTIRQGMQVTNNYKGEFFPEGDRSYSVADSKFGKNVAFV